jgi:hypothetical protein
MMKRKVKIERRRASSGAFEREPFEGARSFGISLSRRLCFPSGRSLPSSRSSSRALTFARKIAARHARQPGARPLEFLRSYFGGRYGVVEGQGSTGTRIYKKPGGTILESSYKLSLNFSLLLNLTRSVETLNLRLIHNSLTLLQSFAELTKLPGKAASPTRLPSVNTQLVNRASLMNRWSESHSLLKLLSERTHTKAPSSAASVLVRSLTEFLRRDSFTQREVKERVRARGSSARVSNLLVAQERTSAGRGYARALRPAASRADHFNFVLFPQSFNQSFRQTRLNVQSHFGGRYEVVEGQGSTVAGMHSNPGERIQDRLQESSYRLSLNFSLLLNLTRSVETLNLRLMHNSLTLLQSFAELTKLPGKAASPTRLPSVNTSLANCFAQPFFWANNILKLNQPGWTISGSYFESLGKALANRASLMNRWSESHSLLKLLSERTHAQAPSSAAPILVRPSTVFERRDSLARESFVRVSSLLATREASLFINRLNAQAGRVTNGSAEAERSGSSVLHSTATQGIYINTTLSWQSPVSAHERETVSHNFARAHLQQHFLLRGGNPHTSLAFYTQSRAAGRVLIRKQNFLRSLTCNSLAPLAQEAAPLAHDFKQTAVSLFFSETMGLTCAPSQPPVLSGTPSLTFPCLTFPFRPAPLSLSAQAALQREVLRRMEQRRQSELASVLNITTRNSSTLMPVAVRRLARFTSARELTAAAQGRSFSQPGVHEKLAHEGLTLEAYTLETRTPGKLTVKVRPLSPAAQFVTSAMTKMLIGGTRTRLAGPAMISAHTTATINTGAIINVRPRPAAAAQPRPEPFTLNPGRFTLNLARGAASGGFLEPVPALPFGKVDTLRLTPPAYVYAQPVRSTLEEQRVITQIDHKEVTRIVQREVQSARASDVDVARFSHADYAQIADQVYSTLVRRLVVEKERLGLC